MDCSGKTLLRRLPLLNLLHRPYRTAGLILLTAFLAFSLFGGSVLVYSLRQGLNSITARLGADLIAVPLGCETVVESILLKGEPSYFYLDRSCLERISQIDGVGQTSAQFYFTSTSSDCCELPVQLIGFDPTNDFSIQPWIRQTFDGDVTTGALLAGSDIEIAFGSSLTLFGREYPVAAQLEKTGAGLDNAVYANMDTIHDLMAASKEKGFRFLDGIDPEQVISSVLIKVEDGYDLETVARNIRTKLDGVQIVKTKTMISGIADSLKTISGLLRLLTGAVFLLALGMLSIVFSIMANERKTEFAVLRMLGASRRCLVWLFLRESILAGAGGGTVGIGLAALVVFPFSTAISQQLGLPYLPIDAIGITGVLLVSLTITVAAGPAAAAWAVWRISHSDTSQILREGE